jgi:hypothetical protein
MKKYIYLVLIIFGFSSCSEYQKAIKSEDLSLKFDIASKYGMFSFIQLPKVYISLSLALKTIGDEAADIWTSLSLTFDMFFGLNAEEFI